MKWGRIDEISSEKKLLYWVLMFVLAPYFDDPIDHWLKIILTSGGMGGDPGWKMEHILDQHGEGNYRVWADPDISGIDPSEASYSIETVRSAVLDSLRALSNANPDKRDEVIEIIERYKL